MAVPALRSRVSHADRWFGFVYDPVARLLEPLLARHRRWLAAGLEGTVLDLGCGSGLQFPSLDAVDWVERVVGVEPNDRLRRIAERRARTIDVPVDLCAGVGEALPFADDSVDAAVCATVLCSVDDVVAVATEVERVLRPGGDLRILEHVRDDGFHGRVQRALGPVWRPLAGGCHLTRRTGALLAGRDALDVLALERVRPAPPPIRPILRGRFARRC